MNKASGGDEFQQSLGSCLRAQGTLRSIYLFLMRGGLIHKCLINVC